MYVWIKLSTNSVYMLVVLICSHLEGSSTSVGRPGNCQSPVIAVENVDVRQSSILDIALDCIDVSQFRSSSRSVSHILPPCPALFWLYGFRLYI